ncbi:MAG: ubiquinol-cytochrome c reductase iron-sulfur subunit [Candidatus Neomarinimicrobiota bacterium]|tara:strand:- start:341 stop:820 length:480 start_codon:yes stop_codon:yes gene_type:complete
MNDNNINALLNNSCNRREFVKDTLTGIGTVAFGSFMLVNQSGCSSPTEPNNSDETITVDLSLSENSALLVVGGALALGSNVIDSKGILLYRQSDTNVLAFSRNCTHNSCTIDSFQNGTSTCPCHGSQFNTSGNVVVGPAVNPLTQYSAAIADNIVTITT